ncbi:PREDICTED: uncharacterized protein LOC108611527 [Drosophila arizonae]|uniref:Uncharacterized protein LOC108611527 n=1 Tax=Drosophila arizonae TaxID=7263 RepID=A0ABM1NXM5_DROAR|nr:PREDICTED: uncharacterized protein LOC108611527 [Drosophila arizonae]
MLWMATLLAALALRCVISSNRFVAYDELTAPMLARSMPKRCSRLLGVQECGGSIDSGRDGNELPVDAVETEADQSTSKMLNALFGRPASPETIPPTPRPTEAALSPYQLPPMYYNDFYEDLMTSKRNDAHAAGCDCKVMNDLIDLGSTSFPRYLMSAICESRPAQDAKCMHGSNCKPLEYKVKVLTLGPDQVTPKAASSSARLWMPEELTQLWQWQFKTVTVTAGCFCTN